MSPLSSPGVCGSFHPGSLCPVFLPTLSPDTAGGSWGNQICRGCVGLDVPWGWGWGSLEA